MAENKKTHMWIKYHYVKANTSLAYLTFNIQYCAKARDHLFYINSIFSQTALQYLFMKENIKVQY